nr:hypothetical protein [Tanacetum cinerariifolium]
DDGGQKRKLTEIESPGQRTRQSAKKQQVDKKEKEQVNKGKKDEKAKKEEQVKKKMVKLKGKKKVEDDEEDFVVEEQHDEEDNNKNFETKFKSLKARTTVLPLYDATQSLSPERISKLIYLHYTKCNGMMTIPRKWPAIRNWTSKDATDREIFKMCQGRFGLVDVIEEIENESKVEKQKLKEEEFTIILNRDENKAGTSGARHENDNDDVDYDGHCNDEYDFGHVNHEDVHANEEKEANEATKKKEKAEKLVAEKKEKAKKLAATKKKEAAEKSAKNAAEKTTKEAKEKAEKEVEKKLKGKR